MFKKKKEIRKSVLKSSLSYPRITALELEDANGAKVK